MPNRKTYWKKYYDKKVKTDPAKMRKRRLNANNYKIAWIHLRIKRATFYRILREVKGETAKQVMREITLEVVPRNDSD